MDHLIAMSPAVLLIHSSLLFFVQDRNPPVIAFCVDQRTFPFSQGQTSSVSIPQCVPWHCVCKLIKIARDLHSRISHRKLRAFLIIGARIKRAGVLKWTSNHRIWFCVHDQRLDLVLLFYRRKRYSRYSVMHGVGKDFPVTFRIARWFPR